MIISIPKKYCKHVNSKNIETSGVQAHRGYPDEGSLSIRSGSFKLYITDRKDMKNLKKILDFVLKSKPQTKKDHDKQMKEIFGEKHK